MAPKIRNLLERSQRLLRRVDDSPTMRLRRFGLWSGTAFVAIVAIAATGCGSGGSTASANVETATTTTTGTGTGARNNAAFQKFAACMKKQGVTVATTFGARPGAGSGAPPTGNPPSGAPATPNGRPVRVANPKFQAAFAACRSVAPQGFGTRRAGAAPNNQQFQRFTACMKSHGVTLPAAAQQTAKPIDRNSSSYKKAAAACDKLLPGPGATTTQGG